MGLFRWLSGKRDGGNGAAPAASLFWQQHPSIYEHVTSHIKAGQNGLTEGGEELPDDKRVAARSKLRWMAGAMDGVFSHHFGAPAKDPEKVNGLLAAIRAYCASPTDPNKQKLHDLMVEQSVLESVDPLLETLTKEPGLNHTRLHDLARSLATGSPDREPVKLGVAILGLFREVSDRTIFKTLGRHEEFTLFCAVALTNASDAPDDDLWEVAQNVHGWGRIHVVERLAKTSKPKIKEWLLREGYKNSVMDEYLAYTCAVNGGLRAALEKDTVDDGLLQSAGEIISALVSGGPAENMNDYDDGPIVVERYLRHLSPRASTVKQFLVVSAVRDWLTAKDKDWKEAEKRGWSSDRRSSVGAQCQAILDRKQWPDLVLAGLRSADERTFYDADRAASALKIDAWPYHWQRLKDAPQQSGRWFSVMRACNGERIGQAMALAEGSLPLDAIATGPASSDGLGLEYEPHRCLDCILQDLGRFPGQGTAVVKAGLRSPVIRNRNMAVRALGEWGRANWPPGMEASLTTAISKEPEPKVKALMEKVLAGKSWDEINREKPQE